MRYFSEKTIAGLLEQIDKHYVEELDKLPSIEIKEPHGALKDADAIRKWLSEQHEFSMVTTCKIDKIIADSPTIVEASA